jgi:ATP-dependent protease HslVU (ClpYQ) ATPase subunit
LRANIGKLFLICVPNPDKWIEFGWLGKSVDQILEDLTKEEIPTYPPDLPKNNKSASSSTNRQTHSQCLFNKLTNPENQCSNEKKSQEKRSKTQIVAVDSDDPIKVRDQVDGLPTSKLADPKCTFEDMDCSASPEEEHMEELAT